MEEKISVTFKAGTEFKAPWVVLKAESIEVMAEDLTKVAALFSDVGFLAKAFEEAFKSAPATAGELIKQKLGATQMTMEPPTNAGPESVATPAAPWNQPQAPVQEPWATGAPTGYVPPAPAGWAPPIVEPDRWLIEVPRELMDAWSGPKGPDGKAVKGGGFRGELQASPPNGPGLKVDWDKDAKRNWIPRNTDPSILEYIRSRGYGLK